MAKMETIHISGGGHNQIKICAAVVQCGYRVALSDPDSSCSCINYATYFQHIDISEFKDVYEWAKLNNCIFSLSDSSDIGLKCSIYINERLDSKDSHEIMCDYLYEKSYQHRYLIKKGFKANLPKSLIAKCKQDIETNEKNLEFPVVIKPVDSQGSKGVIIANTYSQLTNSCDIAFKSSKAHKCIVQSMIQGPEVSIDSIKSNGEVLNVCFGLKIRYKSNPCLDQRITFLQNLEGNIYGSLRLLHNKILKAVEYDNSQFHAEYIFSLKHKKWYLIEFAARGGGGGISSYVIKYLTGFNPQFFQILVKTNSNLSHSYHHIKSSNHSNNEKTYCTLIFTPREWSLNKLRSRIEAISKKYPMIKILDYSKKLGGYYSEQTKPIKDSSDRGNFIILGSELKESIFHSKFEQELLNL